MGFQNYLTSLHSIEVTVQDAKLMVYLQPLLRIFLYKMDYYLSVDAILFFNMATMKKIILKNWDIF